MKKPQQSSTYTLKSKLAGLKFFNMFNDEDTLPEEILWRKVLDRALADIFLKGIPEEHKKEALSFIFNFETKWYLEEVLSNANLNFSVDKIQTVVDNMLSLEEEIGKDKFLNLTFTEESFKKFFCS